jgi:hypothetical protein
MTPRRPYAERVPNTSPCRLVQWTTGNVGKSSVAATNDVDALLALKPDCVVYNPMRIDVDELRQPAVDRGRGHLRQGRQDHRHEAADTTFYDSPATEKPVGFGEPIDHPDLQAMTAKGTGVFGEAVRMVADALGIELDEVRCEAEYAQTTEGSRSRVVDHLPLILPRGVVPVG